MGYLSSARGHRGRGGYGVTTRRNRGGLPLLALGGSLLSGVIKRTGVLRRVGKALGFGATAAATAVTIGSAIPGAAPPGMGKTPGIKGKLQRVLPGGESGYFKRRRMNVANAKALRRAIRRTDGFVKLARRTLKGTGFTIARRGLSKAAKTRKR